MNTKKLSVTATGVMLAAFALGAVADPGDMGHPNKGANEQRTTNPHKDVPGTQNPGNEHRDNENSNRQSDPGSTRGLERAEERHAEQADEHARPEKERRWYDFLFGKDDKDKDNDMAQKEPRWWWPFN